MTNPFGIGILNNAFYDVQGCTNGSNSYSLGKNYKIDVHKGDGQLKTCFKQCPENFIPEHNGDYKDNNNLPLCIVKKIIVVIMYDYIITCI